MMKIKFLIYIFLIIFTLSPLKADESGNEISFFTGTFDVIYKEGDDKTSLFGIDHFSLYDS